MRDKRKSPNKARAGGKYYEGIQGGPTYLYSHNKINLKAKSSIFFKLNFKSHPMEVVSNLNLVLISTLPLRILRTN